MKLKESVELLEKYNEWRMGAEYVVMPRPKDVTSALSTLIDFVKFMEGSFQEEL